MVSACSDVPLPLQWKIFIIGSFWAAWTYHRLQYMLAQGWHEMAILALKYGGPTHPFLAAHNGPSRLSLAAVAAAATAPMRRRCCCWLQKVKTFHTLTLHFERTPSGSPPPPPTRSLVPPRWRIENLLQKSPGHQFPLLVNAAAAACKEPSIATYS